MKPFYSPCQNRVYYYKTYAKMEHCFKIRFDVATLTQPKTIADQSFITLFGFPIRIPASFSSMKIVNMNASFRNNMSPLIGRNP